MTDPQDVHGGECWHCLTWFADNEQDLDTRGLCADCAADALREAYDDALAAYQDADEAVAMAKADVADQPYLQQLTVLVPLYTDLLEAHAASEAARAAAADLLPDDWFDMAVEITGAAR
jgi:hypothetical protein